MFRVGVEGICYFRVELEFFYKESWIRVFFTKRVEFELCIVKRVERWVI